MLQKIYDLGVTPPHSRPRVSDDNPYLESLPRTLKYCPQWPRQGFADLEAARNWVRGFIRWYNDEHRHSRIRLVTLPERHQGKDRDVRARRHALYQGDRNRSAQRWSGATHNWSPSVLWH